MRISRLLAALASLAIAVPAAGADLKKIDRTVAKEPIYQTKSPKYCLLVFGPEAKTRVWLVQDGDTLYIDRNANADLTEDAEKVASKEGDSTDAAQGVFYFEGGDIRDGTLLHKNLRLTVEKLDYLVDKDERAKELLARDPKVRGYALQVDVEMPGCKGSGLGGRVEQLSCRDVNGFLKFGDKPAEAPVIHFGGPLQVKVDERQRLTVGRETELFLKVGTPGLGAGTFARLGYQGVIPRDTYPKVEITYPPKAKGEAPVKELYELKHRC